MGSCILIDYLKMTSFFIIPAFVIFISLGTSGSDVVIKEEVWMTVTQMTLSVPLFM